MRNCGLWVLVMMATLPVFGARAQDDAAINDRLSRIERDLNYLQRQAYHGAVPADSDGADAAAALGPASASVEVRLGQINDSLRALRGQIEQAQYQSRQNAEDIKRMAADIEYRFQAMDQKLAQQQATAAAAQASANGYAVNGDGTEPADAVDTAGNPVKATVKASPTGKDFPDANAHYNYAFKLLNDKNYSAAAASFDAFVKKYPSDPLVGNAYYWLGESYYARGDYTRASEGFRKGYEANPDGEKAADNLLKLAMSLAQVKRVPEACVVLGQIGAKYGQSNARTAARAAAERTTLQCK